MNRPSEQLTFDYTAAITTLFKIAHGKIDDPRQRDPETLEATRKLLLKVRFPLDLSDSFAKRIHQVTADPVNWIADLYIYTLARRKGVILTGGDYPDVFDYLYTHLHA